ncbi:MAG: hypothetical protein LBI57_06725, partial [Helicobacteraceae bacterium]|nr:hypothetical protein [Helicobacteraceae bacterium]
STTLKDYTFIKPLNKIKSIMIDYCIASDDFTLLNIPALKELGLSSIKSIENIDAIKDFKTIEKLYLSGAKIKLLPDMSKLIKLETLYLNNLKAWENTEILKTIPNLKHLELREINTKLEAERFYFLTEIETLNEIEFKFIDFNKKRIDLLNKWFIKNGKENIIIK